MREGQAGAGPGVAHLLQVGEGDGLAGQHLVGLAGERRQRRQLLPVGQAAAQHSQTGADQEDGWGWAVRPVCSAQPSLGKPRSLGPEKQGDGHLRSPQTRSGPTSLSLRTLEGHGANRADMNICWGTGEICCQSPGLHPNNKPGLGLRLQS